MSRKYLLSLLFFSFALVSNSQVKISGRILNASNEPVPGATITLLPSMKSVISTSTGTFELQAETGDNLIDVSAIGFASRSIPLTTSTTYDIVLAQSVTDLQDVVFVGSRAAQRSRYNSIVPVDVVRLSDVRLQIPQVGVN